eukprot:4394474-Ditylum_brightwellii.AAC.1
MHEGEKKKKVREEKTGGTSVGRGKKKRQEGQSQKNKQKCMLMALADLHSLMLDCPKQSLIL